MIYVILIIISLRMLVILIKRREKLTKRILMPLLCFVWGVLSMLKDVFTQSAFPIILSLLMNITICVLPFTLLYWKDHEEDRQ